MEWIARKIIVNLHKWGNLHRFNTRYLWLSVFSPCTCSSSVPPGLHQLQEVYPRDDVAPCRPAHHPQRHLLWSRFVSLWSNCYLVETVCSVTVIFRNIPLTFLRSYRWHLSILHASCQAHLSHVGLYGWPEKDLRPQGPGQLVCILNPTKRHTRRIKRSFLASATKPYLCARQVPRGSCHPEEGDFPRWAN